MVADWARSWYERLRPVGRYLHEHDLLVHAAGLAFHALVTIVPSLVVIAWVASSLLGEGRTEDLAERIGAGAGVATLVLVALWSYVANAFLLIGFIVLRAVAGQEGPLRAVALDLTDGHPDTAGAGAHDASGASGGVSELRGAGSP